MGRGAGMGPAGAASAGAKAAGAAAAAAGMGPAGTGAAGGARPPLAEDVALTGLDERAARRVVGKPHPDRARQFKPFAALKGYYALIQERERVPEPRRELAEEDQRELSEQLSCLARGQVVAVTYYDNDAYETRTGAVTQVDEVFRTLWIVRTPIPFDAIARIDEAPCAGQA